MAANFATIADAVPGHPPVDLEAALHAQGFAFIAGTTLRTWLAQAGSLHDWNTFAQSWNALELDTFMGDGGRYRRRRHAVFAVPRGGQAVRQPHQPHWQGRDYNPLNGGIARWFSPMLEAVADSHSFRAVLEFSRKLFDALAPQTNHWKIEAHQFRIEAACDAPGKPTPEGMHRDGVDFVLVLMIGRANIAQGETAIHALDGKHLGSFTLAQPFDAAIVEDARVFHGVTAVQPIDPSQPAARDVLVVTFQGVEAKPSAS